MFELGFGAAPVPIVELHMREQALQPIGTFNTLDFGVIAATNELGLTEGNSFVTAAPAPGSVIIGRPLEGREVNIELKYRF